MRLTRQFYGVRNNAHFENTKEDMQYGFKIQGGHFKISIEQIAFKILQND